MTALIEYGPVTLVLGTGWKADKFRLDQQFTPDELEHWWQRTDFGWRCDACPNKAGVLLKTLVAAKQHAEKHATEHPGSTVVEIRPYPPGFIEALAATMPEGALEDWGK